MLVCIRVLSCVVSLSCGVFHKMWCLPGPLPCPTASWAWYGFRGKVWSLTGQNAKSLSVLCDWWVKHAIGMPENGLLNSFSLAKIAFASIRLEDVSSFLYYKEDRSLLEGFISEYLGLISAHLTGGNKRYIAEMGKALELIKAQSYSHPALYPRSQVSNLWERVSTSDACSAGKYFLLAC